MHTVDIHIYVSFDMCIHKPLLYIEREILDHHSYMYVCIYVYISRNTQTTAERAALLVEGCRLGFWV